MSRMARLEPILLVEDNPDDVLLVQRALRRTQANLALQVVGDGERAIAYLAGHGDYADRDRYPFPFLLLLDLKLPRQSGFEVLTWLRQQPGLCRLPVAVLTSSREESDVRRAYDLGANSYLVKPGSFDALVALVASVEHYWAELNEHPSIAGG